MKIQYTLLLFLLILILFNCGKPNVNEESRFIDDFSKLLKPVPDHAILTQEGYFVWGASVMKDEKGFFTKAGPSLALFTSKNGIDWLPSENSLVSLLGYTKEDGTRKPVYRLERPQVLIEEGKPLVLYLSVADTTGGELSSYNIHIPLEIKTIKTKKINIKT